MAMNIIKVGSLFMLFIFLLVSCSENTGQSAVSSTVAGRWYTQAQIHDGNELYDVKCMSCHGPKGGGTVRNWQQTLEDGSYPPPPLNGTAHTWHHSKKALAHTIKNGGLALGGKMPGFKDSLSITQVDALIAYIQSLWPDKIYQSWESRNK